MAESIILGIVQGIAEWLPISSEGLVVLLKANFFEKSLDLDSLISYALFLHLGTFLAALIYFRKEVLDLALEVVMDLAKTDLSSSEKRDAAFDAIKEKLEAEGKVVGNSLINLSIELAVQRLKSLQ